MAEQHVPRWPSYAVGPRVLVECEDPAVQDGLERMLHEAGYSTATCAGPDSRGGRCPLVTTGRCGLVEDADLVVQAFDPDRGDLRAVLAAIRERRPDLPVVVEVSSTHDKRDPELLAGCRAVRFPVSADVLRTAVLELIPCTETV